MGSKKKQTEVPKELKDIHIYCLEVLVEEIRVMREESRSSLASSRSGRSRLKLNRRTYLSSQGSRTRKGSAQEQAKEEKEKALPPLRVGIEVFHMKDMYVHQVDLEKLYPPSQDEVSEDSDTPPDTPPPEKKKTSEPEEVSHETNGVTSGSSRESKTPGSSSTPSKSGRSKVTTSSGSRSTGLDSRRSGTTSESSSPRSKTSKDGVDASELEGALLELESPTPEEIEEAEKRKLRKEIERRERTERRERRELERQRRAEEGRRRAAALRRLQWPPEFRRGVSLVFRSSPEELIHELTGGRLRLTVERWDGHCAPTKVGRSSLKMPSSYAELVRRAAMTSTKESAVLEDAGVLKDSTGEVGSVLVYLCLTCLGPAVSCLSESALYSFIKLSDRLPPCLKQDTPTSQSEPDKKHKALTPGRVK